MKHHWHGKNVGSQNGKADKIRRQGINPNNNSDLNHEASSLMASAQATVRPRFPVRIAAIYIHNISIKTAFYA